MQEISALEFSFEEPSAVNKKTNSGGQPLELKEKPYTGSRIFKVYEVEDIPPQVDSAELGHHSPRDVVRGRPMEMMPLMQLEKEAKLGDSDHSLHQLFEL